METIDRVLQAKIAARLAPNKVVLIFGARRVGKTVMLRKIVDGYAGRTMMLNGEDYDTLALLGNRSVANYRHLLENIDLLAIDEAQNIPQIGHILKLIVDEIPGISIVASGSSSFELLNKTGEPLVGRSTQFLLSPTLFRSLLLHRHLLIRSHRSLRLHKDRCLINHSSSLSMLQDLQVRLPGTV